MGRAISASLPLLFQRGARILTKRAAEHARVSPRGQSFITHVGRRPCRRAPSVAQAVLALPEAHEVEAWGEPTFRVRNKMFAMYANANNHHGDGRHAVWVKAPPDEQRQMVVAAPAQFFVPPYVGKSGWVGLWLDGEVDWDIVEEVLRDGYRLVATKRLLRGELERIWCDGDCFWPGCVVGWSIVRGNFGFASRFIHGITRCRSTPAKLPAGGCFTNRSTKSWPMASGWPPWRSRRWATGRWGRRSSTWGRAWRARSTAPVLKHRCGCGLWVACTSNGWCSTGRFRPGFNCHRGPPPGWCRTKLRPKKDWKSCGVGSRGCGRKHIVPCILWPDHCRSRSGTAFICGTPKCI